MAHVLTVARLLLGVLVYCSITSFPFSPIIIHLSISEAGKEGKTKSKGMMHVIYVYMF